MECERDDVHRKAIHSAVMARMAKGGLEETGWGSRLLDLVSEVRDAVSGAGDYRMQEPRIVFHKKADGGCRPIAVYDCLVDRLIIGLVARYISGLLDPLFVPESHAFRRQNLSHHSAVASILRFRAANSDCPLHAAECDIRKFYDTVSHRVAMDAMRKAAALHGLRNPGAGVDPRAMRLLGKYLDSYSFPGTVLPAAARLAAEKKSAIRVEWLTDGELRGMYGAAGEERIGIPQGGALSMVIGNLVMDAADRSVLGGVPDPGLFYARFCDDMVILHRDRGRCEAALRRYMEALRALKLAAHPPVDIGLYGPSFFTTKSKLPYQWGPLDKDSAGVSPWVSFVGYQVRYDGRLRIRRESIAREQKRQIRAAGEVIRLVKSDPGALRLAPGSIMNRLKARMVMHAVGRVDLKAHHGQSPGLCWTEGFRLLGGHPHDARQLKALDYMRERQWRRVGRCLEQNAGWRRQGEAGSFVNSRYYGAPYSHFGCFKRAHQKIRYSAGSWRIAYNAG